MNNKRRTVKMMRNNHDIVCGEVISVKPNRSGGLLFYKFNYNGRFYEKHASCLTATKREFERGRRKIPVVVLKDKGDHSDILETEKDFLTYRVTYSDTLNKNCVD